MKHKFSKVLCVLTAISLCLLGCGTSNKNGEVTNKNSQYPETIKIGYVPSAGILQVLPIVANDKGWFQEEFKDTNTKIQFVAFKTGPLIMEAFNAKKVDVGHIGDQPIFSSRANGVDLKAFGLHSIGDKNYGLVVTNKSGANSFKELKGKKIGVSLGTIGQRIYNLYLEKYDLKDEDIEVINIPPSDMKTALETNNVDGAIIWQPWIGVIESENIGKQVEDTVGLKTNININIAATEFMNKYPEAIKKLLKVYIRTEKWVNENKPEAAKIIAKEMKIDENIILKAIEKEQYVVNITQESIDSMEDTSQFLKKIGVLREDVQAKECVELKFLKELGIQ
ncbi:MAG: NrtA/SsuA/CpmA family ABC transporter substrate-binding protein [Clostridium sp.]